MTVEVQSFGEVFTRRWVVEFILDLCRYSPERPLHTMTVIEPSVGSGAFIGPIVERLLQAKPDEVPWDSLTNCIRGFDVQVQHVDSCRNLVSELLQSRGCPLDTAELLANQWIVLRDFLLHDDLDSAVSIDQLSADFVIGNPPYIRIEDIEPGLLGQYRKACPTMRGRADIFVGFYEHGLDLLKPGGTLAYICADRWMRNSYGRELRRKIVHDGFSVDGVIVMHDVNAFESEVAAYPAITLLRRGQQGRALNTVTGQSFDESSVRKLLAWRNTGSASITDESMDSALLPHWHVTEDVWPSGSPETVAWLSTLDSKYHPIESESGRTEIGIGIATGADRVFLRKEPPPVEKSHLVPLAMGRDVSRGKFEWTGTHLVSPWTPHGVVDLDTVPLLKEYFNTHSEDLRSRHVAQRSSNWYRTIDRLNHRLLDKELLVMEDMKARPNPVLVPAGFYPHHNLTWITSDEWDLEVLGGLLMSEVVALQVSAYCVQMRGGTLRFQPTVMRKVRLPAPEDIGPHVAKSLTGAFRKRDYGGATSAALEAFGLSRLPV